MGLDPQKCNHETIVNINMETLTEKVLNPSGTFSDDAAYSAIAKHVYFDLDVLFLFLQGLYSFENIIFIYCHQLSMYVCANV